MRSSAWPRHRLATRSSACRDVARGLWVLTFMLATPTMANAAETHSAPAPATVALRFGSIARRPFALETAWTASEQARGLMARDALPPRGGMLFVFARAAQRSFWMKNTRIALDLIFLGADCRVVGLQANAVPGDETPLTVPAPAQYVVELAAGQIAAERLTVGQMSYFEVATHLCPRPQPALRPQRSDGSQDT